MTALKNGTYSTLTDIVSNLPKQYRSDQMSIYLAGNSSLYAQGIISDYDDLEWIEPVAYSGDRIHEVRLNGTTPLGFNINLEDNHVVLEGYTNDAPVVLRCLTPAAIFLTKIESSKESDLLSVELISNHIEAQDIIVAINSCIEINSEDSLVNLTKLALSEIACLYYWGNPNLTAKLSKLVDRLKFGEHLIQEIRYSFGLDLNVPYSPSKDAWASVNRSAEELLAAG